MKSFLSMAALALAGAIMTGCSGSDDSIDTPPQPENTGKVVTLTTTVGLAAGDGTEAGAGDGSGTRALTIDYENKQCVKTFAERDHIAVIYKNTGGETVMEESEELMAEEIAADGKSANFTVTLTDPDYDAPIRYIYPSAMAKFDIDPDATIDDEGTVDFGYLEEQDGDLETLDSSFDLCTFDAANWTSGALPSGTLTNQLAILALTLKDNIRNIGITSYITSNNIKLTISDGTNSYTIWGCDDDGHIYVAIRPTDNANITVTIQDKNTQMVYYEKSLTGKSYLAGNIYNVSWLMMPTQYAVPLTMEALTDGNIMVNSPREGMQYSVNGGEKTTMTGTKTITSLKKGDKVQFYGNSAAYYSAVYYSNEAYEEDYTSIAGGTADVKVYGNIMSLVDETGFSPNTSLTAMNTFRFLFSGNTKLKDASGLLLPATTLTESCYWGMFQGCISLTAAPVLPAETLAEHCYQHMFCGCSQLNSVTCLATNISARWCTSGWLDGVAASGTFTKAAGVSWPTSQSSNLYSGIPSGWTVQNYVAPTE